MTSFPRLRPAEMTTSPPAADEGSTRSEIMWSWNFRSAILVDWLAIGDFFGFAYIG